MAEQQQCAVEDLLHGIYRSRGEFQDHLSPSQRRYKKPVKKNDFKEYKIKYIRN